MIVNLWDHLQAATLLHPNAITKNFVIDLDEYRIIKHGNVRQAGDEYLGYDGCWYAASPGFMINTDIVRRKVAVCNS